MQDYFLLIVSLKILISKNKTCNLGKIRLDGAKNVNNPNFGIITVFRVIKEL